MQQNPDITDRKALDMLVTQFYRKATRDPIIGFFFTDISRLDLQHHLPKIASFWEMQLFGVRNYRGNPYQVHKLLNQQAHLSPHHFIHWVYLFQQTVDELFAGPNAEKIKRNAAMIARKMSAVYSAKDAESRPVLGATVQQFQP